MKSSMVSTRALCVSCLLVWPPWVATTERPQPASMAALWSCQRHGRPCSEQRGTEASCSGTGGASTHFWPPVRTIWAPRLLRKTTQTWQHDAHGPREKCANKVIDGRAALRTDGDGCDEEVNCFSSLGDARGVPHQRAQPGGPPVDHQVTKG